MRDGKRNKKLKGEKKKEKDRTQCFKIIWCHDLRHLSIKLHNELRVIITDWKNEVFLLNKPEIENIYAQSAGILYISHKYQNYYKAFPKL